MVAALAGSPCVAAEPELPPYGGSKRPPPTRLRAEEAWSVAVAHAKQRGIDLGERKAQPYAIWNFDGELWWAFPFESRPAKSYLAVSDRTKEVRDHLGR